MLAREMFTLLIQDIWHRHNSQTINAKVLSIMQGLRQDRHHRLQVSTAQALVHWE